MSAIYPLSDLFPKAIPSPHQVFDNSEGCSLLVLACHCAMIRDGYILTTEDMSSSYSGYRLPSDWNSSSTTWSLRYTHDAYENEFILEAHRNKTQLLIRVLEDPVADGEQGAPMKVQQIGLSADRYVLDVGLLNVRSWQGVMSDEAVGRFSTLWSQHMAGPLMASATPRQAQSLRRKSHRLANGSSCPYNYLSSTSALTVVVVVGAAVAGMLLAYRSQMFTLKTACRSSAR